MSGMPQSASHPNLVQAQGGSPSRQNSADPSSPRLLGRGSGHDYSLPHLHQQQQVLSPRPPSSLAPAAQLPQ